MTNEQREVLKSKWERNTLEASTVYQVGVPINIEML